MSPRQRCVLAALGDGRDEFWPYLATVAEQIEMPHRDVRNAARALGRKGLARIERLFDEFSGYTAGSTYVRTAAGNAALREMELGDG